MVQVMLTQTGPWRNTLFLRNTPRGEALLMGPLSIVGISPGRASTAIAQGASRNDEHASFTGRP